MSAIALITGATRGIGFEIARQLAQRQLHVVLGARTPAAGEKAVAAIRAQGGMATVLPIDVRDSGSIQAAAHTFSRIADHLDVLVNNAGIYPVQDLSILTVSRDHLTATFQTNTFGPIVMAQAFLPFLRKAPRARIINVSSGYGSLDELSP